MELMDDAVDSKEVIFDFKYIFFSMDKFDDLNPCILFVSYNCNMLLRNTASVTSEHFSWRSRACSVDLLQAVLNLD